MKWTRNGIRIRKLELDFTWTSAADLDRIQLGSHNSLFSLTFNSQYSFDSIQFAWIGLDWIRFDLFHVDFCLLFIIRTGTTAEGPYDQYFTQRSTARDARCDLGRCTLLFIVRCLRPYPGRRLRRQLARTQWRRRRRGTPRSQRIVCTNGERRMTTLGGQNATLHRTGVHRQLGAWLAVNARFKRAVENSERWNEGGVCDRIDKGEQ